METKILRIAVYGAAANPPHMGHMDCLAQLLELGYDRIYFLPAVSHAFGKTMKSLERRMVMAELLVAERFPEEKRIIVSGLEAGVLRASPNERVYSIDVLEHLRMIHPDADIHLALGPDNADPAVFRRFKAHERLAMEFGVVPLQERLHVRSTKIRADIACDSPNRDTLERDLGAALTKYLLANNIYRVTKTAV